MARLRDAERCVLAPDVRATRLRVTMEGIYMAVPAKVS